jgi:hypothetical protein
MVYGFSWQARVHIGAALLSGLLCALSLPAWADELTPFCDPMPGLLTHDFSPTRLSDISNASEAARATAETSPFANACQDPTLLKDRPPTGIFRRSVPLFDSQGRSSAELLKRIGARVLDSMSQEELRLSVMSDCLSGKMARASKACLDVRAKIESEILAPVRAARIKLAVSQTTAQIQTAVLQHGSLHTNESLDSLGTQKETSWDRLEPSESKKASKILAEFKSESETEAARLVATGKLTKRNIPRFVNDAILSARFTSGLEYIEILSRNPILQYLKSAKPSDNEIMQAVQKMQQHLKSDRDYAEKAVRAASETSSYGSVRGVRYKNGPLREINPDALSLLDFTSHTESVLQESGEFCGLAASLQETKENRALGNGLAIGVPLIVASLALPLAGQAIAGAVIGGVGGVGYAVSSKFDRNHAADRFISKMKAESEEEYRKLDQADRDFKIAMVLGPAGAVAGPGVRAATVGLRATRFGAWLASKASAVEKVAAEAKDLPSTGAPK